MQELLLYTDFGSVWPVNKVQEQLVTVDPTSLGQHKYIMYKKTYIIF